MNVSELADEVEVEHVGNAVTGSVEIQASVLTISFPYFARNRVADGLREAAEEILEVNAPTRVGPFADAEEAREVAALVIQIAERVEEL